MATPELNESGEAVERSTTAEGNSTVAMSRFSSGYLRYVIFVFFLVNLLGMMDRSVLAVLVEPIKRDLSLSDSQMGLLSFAFAAFYAIFGLLIGRLTDTSSRATLLSVAVGLFSIATALSGLAQSFLQLFFARVGAGIGDAGAVPTKYSMIGDYFPPERRASAMALMQAGLGVGPALGLVVGGLLAQEIGWRMTLIVFGAPGVLVALCIALTIREPERGLFERETRAVQAPSLRETLQALAKNRTFRFIVLAFSATTFSIYGIGYWMPTFMVRSFGVSLAEVGLLYGATVGLSMIAGLVVGALLSPKLLEMDRRWEMWTPAIVNLMVALTYAIVFTAGSFNVALIFVAVTMFFLGLTVGPASAAIQSTVGARMRGVAVAITMLLSALLGQGLGPWAIGVGSDMFAASHGDASLALVLLFTPVVLVIGGCLYFFGARTFQTDRVD
jgi:predicted MFS family arabinose efflux permease